MESASGLAEKYRAGHLSPLEAVDSCLRQIEALNPDLHAFVGVFHQSARVAAEQAAADFARGKDCGPLQGIPVAIKDLATTGEGPSAAGTTFLQDYLGQNDAKLVALLRRQGAVIIGKTTMTEGAFSVHHSSVATPVNPWAPDYWTGVSSSGSGVAVASGLVPLALGSDTGGSIRLPSACNHLVGHMPTYGSVSVQGCFALAPSLDHMGPMARTVNDCEAMYRVMAEIAETAFAAPLKQRIGVDFGGMEQACTPQVRQLLAQVVADYQGLGFELVDIRLPQEQLQLAAGWIQTVAVEATRVHAPYLARHAEEYGPAFCFLLDLASQVDQTRLESLEVSRLQFAAALDTVLQDLDALLCPVMPAPAPNIIEMAARQPTPDEIARSMLYTAPFNYSGHPALTLPAGFIETVPSGYQLIGKKGADLTLFQVARRHEQIRNWADQAPQLSARQ